MTFAVKQWKDYPDQTTPITAASLQDLETRVSAYTDTFAAPSGVTVPYAGSSAPSNWLLCDGSAVSRVTYSVLFAIISTTFGSGDGSTTFNLPDLRGKFPLGVSGSHALATTGGSETTTISVANLPAHHHTQQGSFASGTESADHTHDVSSTFTAGRLRADLSTGGSAGAHQDAFGSSNVGNNSGSTGGISANHTHTTTISGNTADTGSGTAATTVSPFLSLNYIIKT